MDPEWALELPMWMVAVAADVVRVRDVGYNVSDLTSAGKEGDQ